MPHFNWDLSYSVKVKRFDDDHQQLFRILNQLYDGMMARKGQEVLQSVLTQLLHYTEQHFAAEEAAMKAVGFPQLQVQIDQHRKFTAKIQDVMDKYKTGSLGISIDVLDFLTNWLRQHIVALDQQYGDFMNAKGIV